MLEAIKKDKISEDYLITPKGRFIVKMQLELPLAVILLKAYFLNVLDETIQA